MHRDGAVAAEGRARTSRPRQAFQRERIVAAIEHKRAAGMKRRRGRRRLPARRRLHDAQPLRRAQDARGPRAGAGVHHEGRAVGRLPRVLRHGAGPAAPPRQRGLPALHRVALRRALDRGEGPLRPARSVERALAEARDVRAAPRDPERHRARRRVGRGRDHRLGLPVLQRPGRAPEDARGEPGAAQQPRAGRAQPVLHAALRRPVPHRQHARPHLVRDARRPRPCSPSAASTWSASPARSSRRARRRTRATCACSTRPAAPGTSCSTPSTCCSRSTRRRYADPESPTSEATGRTLAEDYPSLDALRKAVPGLILAHNLHGVDIDPRCAQIAQLALWMRAQKAYRDFGIGRAERAQIRRSNIVVAEPLVADEQIAKEFVAKLGDAELGRVFTSLVESLSLAGDLGLLLARRAARQRARRSGGQTGDLFAPPEERIRAALRSLRARGGESRSEHAAAPLRRRRGAGRGAARRRREEVRRGADESAVRRRQHARQEGLREGVPAHEERRLRGVRRARHRAALHRAGRSERSRRAPASSCRASRSGARRSSSRRRRRSSSPTSATACSIARWSRRPRTAWRRGA